MHRYSRRVSVKGPVHDLAQMQAMVASGKFHPYDKSAVSRVIEEFSCTKLQARRTIQEIFALLSADHYSDTIRLDNGSVADEYGLMFEEKGWYVKFNFAMADDEVDVISCHLTRYPMTTATATIEAFDPPDDY